MAKPVGERHETPDRRDPDHDLARRGVAANRYVLHLRDPRDSAIVLRVLDELSIPLGYLLLLPSGTNGRHVAYVGLGPHDVADLPIRFAAQGIHVERGEELNDGSRRCVNASGDAPPRAQLPSRRPGPRSGAPRKKRRPA